MSPEMLAPKTKVTSPSAPALPAIASETNVAATRNLLCIEPPSERAPARTITWKPGSTPAGRKMLGWPMYCPNPECPHVQRTGEPAEYREGVTQCQDCGSALVEARPESHAVVYERFVPVFEIPGAALLPF